MDLEFKNVTYTTTRRELKVQMIPKLMTSRLEILHSVSGKFYSGQLTAIMGPSGAGKTCLLNALSGYRSKGVRGEFTVGGRALGKREFHRLSCYITQEDLLQPMLTVGELMNVAASLKLPESCTDEDRWSTVTDILENLGLSEQKNTRTEDLSGGERKRLSIALELVNNPPIFFLDEPTSGLDQVTTIQCVKLLKTLARQNRTVICTIHQPSASILEMFDQVYVVAQGSCIYRGTTDALVPFLSQVGLPCPRYYNPADYVIELTENSSNVEKLCDVTQNGKTFQAVQTSTDSLPVIRHDMNGHCKRSNSNTSIKSSGSKTMAWMKMSSGADSINEYASSGLVQFKVLLKRMIIQIFRNRLGVKIQLVHHLLCSILVSICFYKSTNDGTKTFNNLKFCLGVCLFFAYTQVMVPVLAYPTQVKLVKKEYFNRWYSLFPYYAAMSVSKLPLQIALNMVYITIVYFGSGLPHEITRFVIFSVVCNFISFVAEGLGIAIGSTFNVKNGSAVGPMIIAPLLGLAIYGYDFAKNISWVMNAAMKTSFMRCGLVAIVLTVFGLDRKPLPCDEPYCHLGQPKELLNYLDLQKSSISIQFGELVLLLLFYRVLGYLALWYRFVR